MNIPDHILGVLRNNFWVKILKCSGADAADPGIFFTLDPGWKKNQNRDPI
jgi:hypothetical protein